MWSVFLVQQVLFAELLSLLVRQHEDLSLGVCYESSLRGLSSRVYSRAKFGPIRTRFWADTPPERFLAIR